MNAATFPLPSDDNALLVGKSLDAVVVAAPVDVACAPSKCV